MSNQNLYRNNVRVPNLPTGRIVDENGQPTEEELNFRQALVTLLQNLFGEEGVVIPTQSAANIATIQNNTTTVEGASDNPRYTCQFGTGLYNSTANSIMFAIDNGSGAPIFKTVTLT